MGKLHVPLARELVLKAAFALCSYLELLSPKKKNLHPSRKLTQRMTRERLHHSSAAASYTSQ